MLKIAIDNSPISEKYGLRGIGFYSQRLIDSLKKINHEGIVFESLNLRKLNKENLQQYALFHYPYFDPFFLTLPINKIKPTVVTVHDLIPLKFPNHFPKGLRGWFKWQIQKFSLKGSKAIITDSWNSKADIIEITGIDKNLIHVIYLAADEQFKPLAKAELIQISQKYHLPKKFILYVGDLNWNKNVPGLIEAFNELCQYKKDIYLVMVGKAFLEKDLVERIKVARLIKNLKLEKKIIFLGFIPTKDLVALYNLAFCYCQPSFYEGFGLPVLEAMACGCPVVCSRTSSLIEIGETAAIFINPHQPHTLAEGIKKIMFDKTLKKQLQEKGLKRICNFSWEKTAKQTLAVYRKVLNET